MDPVSLAFAVLGTADLCIKYGKYLIAKYEDYKHAEDDVGETVLNIKSVWLKTEIQLESITKIWESLDPRLQQLFSELLEHLRWKLEFAKASVDKVVIPDQPGKGFSVKKLKAMAYKNSLVKAIEDLENWQARFDPSWYLITRVADSTIDDYLEDASGTKAPTEKLKHIREAISAVDTNVGKQSIFIDHLLIKGNHNKISYSSAFTTRLANGDGEVLVDPTAFSKYADPKREVIHVRDLARRLSNSDPWQFGLLHCRGAVKYIDSSGTHFQLVFDIPPSLSDPRTLRDLLLDRVPHSLDQRFRLAKQLVRSVMFVHTSGFVHKNIRADTIVVFQDGHSVIGPSFLIGFERSRPENAGSLKMGDTNWGMNLYRHPKRQGLHPEDAYVMQHDIYSLGVCLLEIGYWESFVSGTGIRPGPPLYSITEELEAGKYPTSIKRALVSMAHDTLPRKMGQRYTDLTLACLTCLDPGDSNLFGKESDLEDEDGIVVGVQYVEKILLQMDEISI